MRKILSFLLMALFSVGMWAADTYYYRGNQNGWTASEMTESTDGFYAYFAAKGYANNGNSNNNFKVSKTADSWDYNNGYVTRGFNGTDIQNTEGDKSIGLDWSDDNICVYCTVDFYVLVYYPNTIINNTSKPVVCASTTLPEGALYLAGDGWCGAEWNSTDDANKMTWNKAKGIFTKTINGVSAADHKFKVSTYSWGTAYGHDAYDAASSKNVVSCSADDGNVKFQPAMEGTVTVTIDAATKKISVVCQTPVVTFDKEGGDKGSASVEAEYGVAATAITIPEKANYDFKGYYTEDNGTGTAVINADGSWKSSVENYTDKDGKWIARANSTLYAKWEGKNYAITYKDENNAEYSGSNSEALPSSYQYGVGVSLVNGIKADHQFLGWYDNATCTGEAITAIAADATGAKTFYAKWKEIDGGSVTLLAGEGGEVSADKSVWGANAMIADIKANSDVAIYARPNTGYSFDQWTKVSGEGAIKTNAATGEFSAVAYQNASVSASFSENKVAIKPTVHFDAGTAAYTAEASVAAIGIATSSVLTASAATEGFTFAGWTLSSNLVVVSGNAAKDLSITVRTNGDGDAVSAVANYNEDLSTPFVLNGGAVFGETAWKQALPLKKKSGHSTEKIAYITISNLAPVGEADNEAYYFKIVDDENKWYGLSAEGDSYWFLRTTEEQTLADAKNIQLRADRAGNYEIKVDYSTDALKISIAFPELVSSAVTVTAPEHGTITVKNGEEAIGEKVQEGTVLTVSAASKDAAAYDIINLRAYKTGEPATTVEIKNGQLTMPAYPITIIADEKEVVYQTIYFVNKDGWETVNAYVYLDDDHKYIEWPGEAMTKTEEKAKGKDVYSYRFPAKYTKIIFNNGGTKQTKNHSWNASKPYICNGLDYATAADVVLDATAKYYIVGNAEAMGAWDPTAVPSATEKYVIANLPTGDYQFRLSLDGTWDNTKGFSDLKTPVAAGLKAGNYNNICFTLKETSDVTITYDGTTFTVTGNFYYRVPVLKDLLFVPGVWAEEDAKIAAWIWTRKEGYEMEDQWTAFFAPKSEGNDTLSVKLDADADSIVFVRFNKTAEAPSWEDKQDFRWNSLAGDTIDKINLTYTITGWSEGTWDPYIPAKYYLTGDSALVVDAGLDKAKAWNPDAIKVTENTYVFAGLRKGQEYQLKATINGQWESAKTYKDLTAKALGLKTDGADNIIFKMANDGNVTVTLTDKVFTVEGDFAMPTVAIAGNVTGWSPVAMKLAEDKLSASVTLENLAYGLDSFKIVLDGNWISKNGEGESFYTFHRGWNEDKDIKGGNRNMILDRDNAGDYTFTWVFANDSLHIAFPAAPDTATIYFVNTNKDWTDKIYAHAFVGKKGYQEWPGVEMTNTGEKVWEKAIYSAKVPVTYSSVIFNNGEAQTATYAWTKAKPYFCDGTWYANKEAIPEIEPAKYYITGNAALVAYAGLDAESEWNAKAIKVTKDTFVFENLAAGSYLMKVVTKDAEPNWIGYDRLTEKSKGLQDVDDHKIGFTMEQAGNVTVVYKEGVFVVKGDYAKLPKVGLAANFNSWNWAENLLVPAKDSLSASLKVNLGVTDTIRFKIISDNKWLSLNGEGESEYGIHRAWPSAAHVNIVDGRNFALTTDKAGDYIFTWTYADSTITVTFPELESFEVTVTAPTNGTITVKNGEDAISAPVEEGTELTVTAVANDPAVYEIKNLRAYKTGEPATTVEINNGKLIMPAFPITITADEEKIVYQTLYFVDKDGWNGVNAYVFVDEHAVYKIWPGEAMKKEDRKVKEKDLYSYTFPAKYTKIIFNKKDQTETQTVDMLWNATTPYYCNGFWYASEDAVVLDATAKYYITGDNALMGIWNPAAIKVANDSYTFSNLPAGTYRMKVTLEGTWEKDQVKGYSDLTVKDPSFDTNGENDIIFKLNEAGDVTVTYNATTFTVTGNFAQREYYIAGTFTNWAKEMVKMTEKDGNYAATIDIADIAEDPQFKVVYVYGADSVWYGLESYSAMTSDNCSNWEIGGGEANIGIKPTKAGKYSFYFNPNGLFLTVEMPSQGGGTALDNIRATEKAQKVIINGQLLILYNERMYNVQGQTVK